MVLLNLVLISFLLAETRPKVEWTKNGKKVISSLTTDNVWRADKRTADFNYTEYGITTSGSEVRQKLVNKHPNGDTTSGSRVYLLNDDDLQYEMFNFNGNEFTFDVDISQIPCGLAATLFTVEMTRNGTGGGGTTGAEYGCGYCDAQFLGATDEDGHQGVGCAEFDFWEANRFSTLVTAHACSTTGQFGGKNPSGSCDSNGCGYNTYWDDKSFYGPGSTVDTTKKFTVVTQFLTNGGSLSEIKRKYIQNGRTIESPGWLESKRCNNSNYSLAKMGQSFEKGHVIVFALWDSDSGLAWLDSGSAGPCTDSESASYVEQHYPDATIVFSDIKFGPIDSTY